MDGTWNDTEFNIYEIQHALPFEEKVTSVIAFHKKKPESFQSTLLEGKVYKMRYNKTGNDKFFCKLKNGEIMICEGDYKDFLYPNNFDKLTSFLK